MVIPLWFAAGMVDWLCHRASDIEHTTGAKESLFRLGSAAPSRARHVSSPATSNAADGFPSASGESRLPEALHFTENDVDPGVMRARNIHKGGYGRNPNWEATKTLQAVVAKAGDCRGVVCGGLPWHIWAR